MTPTEFFEAQINVIKNALCRNCYVLGEFNLDARMDNRPDYDRKIPLAILNEFANNNELAQIVYFDTWSRVINGIKKESLIDHIYVNDISTVINVKFEVPTFGDHVLVIAELDLNIRRTNKNKIARDWKKYSVNSINVEVSSHYMS